MLRHQFAVAERERPGGSSRMTWPDQAWLALLAGTVPIERLAAMRLIVVVRVLRSFGQGGATRRSGRLCEIVWASKTAHKWLTCAFSPRPTG